jgi:hypothetical protein
LKALLFAIFLGAVLPLWAQAPATASAALAPPAASTAEPVPAAPPIDPAKEAEIRKMIRLSGAEKTMKITMIRLFEASRARNYTLPKEFWTRLETEMDTSELIDQLVPVYNQYYSMEDLKAVNAFYESPAGQHMIEIQPQILGRAMEIGKAWGSQTVQKVMAEMEEEKVKADLRKTDATPPPDSVQPPAPAPKNETRPPGGMPG